MTAFWRVCRPISYCENVQESHVSSLGLRVRLGLLLLWRLVGVLLLLLLLLLLWLLLMLLLLL
jgi:hypothetical protein